MSEDTAYELRQLRERLEWLENEKESLAEENSRLKNAVRNMSAESSLARDMFTEELKHEFPEFDGILWGVAVDGKNKIPYNEVTTLLSFMRKVIFNDMGEKIRYKVRYPLLKQLSHAEFTQYCRALRGCLKSLSEIYLERQEMGEQDV